MPILGTANATEQPVRIGWSPDRGPSTIRTWEGPTAAINPLASQAYLLGLQYDLEQKVGGLASISVTYASFAAAGQTGQGAEIVDNWELLPNTVQKGIFHSDAPLVNALQTNQLDEVKQFIDFPPNKDGTTKPQPTWLPGSNQEKLYRLARAGVDHWEIDQPILKHTWIVPRGQSLTFLYSNVRKLITTAQLIANEGVPADFVLPISTIVAQFADPTRSDGVSFNYGWLKMMPTASLQSYVRREVHSEWKFGLYSSLLVQAASF